MADGPVSYQREDDIAVLTLDDGKANAVSHAVLEGFNEGLSRAEKEARALLITGRDGVFSAGFDLKVIRAGGQATQDLVAAGGELLMRLYTHPQPVVTVCTGHAIAAGALLLLASDHRVGVAGDFKIGLNEVSVNLALPEFLLALAEERISKRHLTQATLASELYQPSQAVDVGYLDEVAAADSARETALAYANKLASYDSGVFATSKRRVRGAVAERVLANLRDDVAQM